MKRSGAIGNEVAVTRRHIGEYDANRRLDIRDIRKITKDVILVNNEVSTKIWGCSSAGRAPALQAGGQEFDSPHLHQSAKAGIFRIFLRLKLSVLIRNHDGTLWHKFSCIMALNKMKRSYTYELYNRNKRV